MIYLAFGAGILGLLVWMGRGGKLLQFREWRLTAAGFAVAAFAGAVFTGLKGQAAVTLVLVVVGLWLAGSARRVGQPAPRARTGPLSERDARAILGVDDGATALDIQAAYTRLMKLAHPDVGGTAGLAAQLNAARDLLLRR